MDKGKFCITDEYTIIETIDAIRAAKHRGVIVLNKAEKVIGFISQGDVLEAIANNVSIYAQVSAIIRPSFLYLKESSLADAYPIFRKKLITVLPVVDEKFNLVDIITLEDILDYATARKITKEKEQ